MTKVKPDHSFVRQGRTLGEWLIDLVSEDRPTRISAGDALSAMHWGIPSFHTDWSDLESMPDAKQPERFKEAARAAVEQNGFPKVNFVHRLCGLRLAISAEHQHAANDMAADFDKAEY